MTITRSVGSNRQRVELPPPDPAGAATPQEQASLRMAQTLIRNSRLVVLSSDAYHIAAANADECVTHTLGSLEEQQI